jgi:orotidine-5'-phosphate decarboxylase
MFIDNLIEKIKNKNNPSVIGLDPRIEYVPLHIRKRVYAQYGENLHGASKAIEIFNKRIIDAVWDIVPAVKLQLACYEALGVEGLKAYAETIGYAHKKDLVVIADGKRNDIGSTAEAYSKAYLGEVSIEGNCFYSGLNADAVTVNPYLGFDGIKPFIDDCKNHKKGIFILVKTSNKSSGQIQDLVLQDGRKLYEEVARLVDQWGQELTGRFGYSSVCAVVGATYPAQAEILRKIMRRAYILVPGYGAQGGTASDAACSFCSDGLGAIVNASRSVMCAWKSDKWNDKFDEYSFDEAARAEAIRMRDDINLAVEKRFSGL